MTEHRKRLIADLIKNDHPDNAESIQIIADEIFRAFDGINRIADALEKMAKFKGIE